MLRALLPAALSTFASFASAEGAEPPLLESVKPEQVTPCVGIPGSTESCVRILACVGSEGLWFDGRAMGWDAGTVEGKLSDGHNCTGEWRSGFAFGTGRSVVSCTDGSRGHVLYYIEHNETGTVEGSGLDTKGRKLRVWTGLNVLEFLKGKDGVPRLNCGTTAIPIS